MKQTMRDMLLSTNLFTEIPDERALSCAVEGVTLRFAIDVFGDLEDITITRMPPSAMDSRTDDAMSEIDEMVDEAEEAADRAERASDEARRAADKAQAIRDRLRGG